MFRFCSLTKTADAWLPSANCALERQYVLFHLRISPAVVGKEQSDQGVKGADRVARRASPGTPSQVPHLGDGVMFTWLARLWGSDHARQLALDHTLVTDLQKSQT